ncbi:Rho/RAC guanine nucleotide exchange factor [Entamoeba marina]
MNRIDAFLLGNLPDKHQKIVECLVNVLNGSSDDYTVKILNWLGDEKSINTVHDIMYSVRTSLFTSFLYFPHAKFRELATDIMMNVLKHMIINDGNTFIERLVATDNVFVSRFALMLSDDSMTLFYNDILTILDQCFDHAITIEDFIQLIRPLTNLMDTSNIPTSIILRSLQKLLSPQFLKNQILFVKYNGLNKLVNLIENGQPDEMFIALNLLRTLMTTKQDNALQAFNKRLFETTLINTLCSILDSREPKLLKQTLELLDILTNTPQNIEPMLGADIFHYLLEFLTFPFEYGVDANAVEAVLHTLLQVNRLKSVVLKLAEVGFPLKLIAILESHTFFTPKSIDIVCDIIFNLINYNETKQQFLCFDLRTVLGELLSCETIDEFTHSKVVTLKKRFDNIVMKADLFSSMQNVMSASVLQKQQIQNMEEVFKLYEYSEQSDESFDVPNEQEILESVYDAIEDSPLLSSTNNNDFGSRLSKSKDISKKPIEEPQLTQELSPHTSFSKKSTTQQNNTVNTTISSDDANDISNENIKDIYDSIKEAKKEEEAKKEIEKKSDIEEKFNVENKENIEPKQPTLKSSSEKHEISRKTMRSSKIRPNEEVQKKIQQQLQKEHESKTMKELSDVGIFEKKSRPIHEQQRQNFLSKQRGNKNKHFNVAKSTAMGKEVLNVPDMTTLSSAQSGVNVSVDNAKLMADLNLKKVIRKHIVKEIYTTEQTYLKGLEKVVNDIYPVLERVLTEQELTTIFSNIQDIHTLHVTFFKKIEERWNEQQDEPLIIMSDLFDWFFKNKSMYDGYLKYITHADEGIHFSFQNCSPNVQTIIREWNQKQIVIPSYLILPIQRLPRYALLLEQLIKATPEIAVNEHSNLISAYSLCKKVTKEFDVEKEEKFLRDGTLTIKSKKKKTLCTIVLMSDKNGLQRSIEIEYGIAEPTVVSLLMGVEMDFDGWLSDLEKCFAEK